MNTGRHLKAGQSIHSLVGRGQDIDESLVGPLLELLAAVLIFVDCAEDRNDLLLSGQRDRTGHLCAGSLDRVNDLCGGLINELVILRL